MRNKLSHEDYWKGRNDDINRWLDEQEISLTQRLNTFYEQAKASTEKQLYEFYGKYAEDNKITRQDAEKKLKGVDLDAYRANAERYKKWADRSPASAVRRWSKELDAQYKASQATRLDMLLQDIRYEMAVLNGDAEGMMGEHLGRVAQHAYEQSFIAPSSTLNRPAIESLVNKPFRGYNYSEDLWGNTVHLANKLEVAFAKGFVQGLSVQKMAQEIRKDFNVQRANAETLIRTDGNHIVNSATLKRYDDAGLKYARIHVHIDDRTSEICKQHDHEDKLYTLEEADGILPAHFNCRSTFIPDRDELMEEHWEDALEPDPLEDDSLDWADKLKAKIKKMSDKDWAIDDVLAIGKTARETDLFAEMLKQDAKLSMEFELSEEDYKIISEAHHGLLKKLHSGEISEGVYRASAGMRDEAFEKYKKLFNQRHHGISFAEEMKTMLEKVRDVGGTFNSATPKSAKKMINRIDDVLQYVPKGWADTVNSQPLLARQKKGRSYFRAGSIRHEDLFINSQKSPSIDDYALVYGQVALEPNGGTATALHELMHVMESRHDHVLRLEREFYEKRTAGEDLQRMSVATGNSAYKPHEVTRVDNFVNAYMGRDYEGDAYELLSMGVQYLYGAPDRLSGDTEYMDFILGMLLTQ